MSDERRPIRSIFETRSHTWVQAGLASKLNSKVAKRARVEALFLLPAFAGVIIVFNNRIALFGLDEPVRVATVFALVILGWAIARDLGRAIGPALFRRMDPGTAGTVGFLIRLATVGASFFVALNVAGVDPRTLAVGGAFTAVIFGLAAQQTLGNLIAGTVLLSARPFRVGDRVRLQGGPLAGKIEGVVSSLGLLYTTFAEGDDNVMVPNSVVLNAAVTPLREPESVNLRARLRPGVTPADLQGLLDDRLLTPMRSEVRITLQELDGDEAIVQIAATPQRSADGPQLASELLEVVAEETPGTTA